MRTLYQTPWWVPVPFLFLIALYVYQAFTDPDFRGVLPWVAVGLGVLIVWRMSVRKVQVDDEQLRVVNLIRNWRVPWDRVMGAGPEPNRWRRGFVDIKGARGSQERIVLGALPTYGPVKDAVIAEIEQMRGKGSRKRK